MIKKNVQYKMKKKMLSIIKSKRKQLTLLTGRKRNKKFFHDPQSK